MLAKIKAWLNQYGILLKPPIQIGLLVLFLSNLKVFWLGLVSVFIPLMKFFQTSQTTNIIFSYFLLAVSIVLLIFATFVPYRKGDWAHFKKVWSNLWEKK